MNRYIELAELRDHNSKVIRHTFICGLVGGLVLAMALATVIMGLGM